MTYILTFTENTDSYTQNLQLEGIREALGNDCEIHRIEEEISFERIDEAVSQAIEEGCDNFMCLCEDEDVSLLEEGLREEYGRNFNKISVVKEEFGRFREADFRANSGRQWPAGVKPTNQNTKQPVNQGNQKTNQGSQKQQTNQVNNQNKGPIEHINVFVCNVNYPFPDLFKKFIDSVNPLVGKNTQGQPIQGVENYIMYCSPLQNQFLRFEDIGAIASEIPGTTFKDDLEGLKNRNVKTNAHCANISKTESLENSLRVLARAAGIKTIKVYLDPSMPVPQNKSIKVNLNGVPSDITVNYEPNFFSKFDEGKNIKVFSALKEIIEAQKNKYKGAKSKIFDAAKKLSGKQKKPEELEKGVKNNPYIEEMKNGWYSFVSALVKATQKFIQEGPGNDKQLTPEQAGALQSKVLELLKQWKNQEYENAKNLAGLVGMDWAVKLASAAVHDLTHSMKVKNRIKRSEQQIEAENMISLDAYWVIKAAFGGDNNYEKFAAEGAVYQSSRETIENMQTADNNLSDVKK